MEDSSVRHDPFSRQTENISKDITLITSSFFFFFEDKKEPSPYQLYLL